MEQSKIIYTLETYQSIYPIYHDFYPVYLPISGAVIRKGLATPLIRRVASICYLCAGAVYVLFLGSPTGSITLVSSLREIPTIAVLHHPFLFVKYRSSFKLQSTQLYKS